MNRDQSKGNLKDNGKVKRTSDEMEDDKNLEAKSKADQKSVKSQMRSGDAAQRDSDRSRNVNAHSSNRR